MLNEQKCFLIQTISGCGIFENTTALPHLGFYDYSPAAPAAA